MARIEIAELLAGSHPFGQPGGLFEWTSGVPAIRACLSFAAGEAKESWSPAPKTKEPPVGGPWLLAGEKAGIEIVGLLAGR